MGKTSIEWTERTWNPIRARNLETGGVGHYCEKVSPGCANCYAERMQKRFRNFTRYNASDRAKVRLFLDRDTLDEPLHWRKPRNVFPCSMTDLFGGFVPDEWLDSIFAVMALTPHLTYQVLTKRIDRAREYLSAPECRDAIGQAAYDEHGIMFTGDPACASEDFRYLEWPLPNVWIVASVENQKEADRRVFDLLRTPAAVRGLSCEPLLGRIDLTDINPARDETPDHLDALRGIVRTSYQTEPTEAKIDWVIVGGESGADARPMHPEWARNLRDQCAAAGVPLFFKQWGAWLPVAMPRRAFKGERRIMDTEGRQAVATWEDVVDCDEVCHAFERVGKKTAGRLLDGQLHSALPSLTPTPTAPAAPSEVE